MTEQAIAARRAYKKMWARKNPDKVRAAQERYWQKRAAQQAQEGRISCRGCEYSSNPARYDGGCTASACVKAQQPAIQAEAISK